MEKKAELKQPYTESQRMNFIVENNHNKGYEIREVETTYEVEEQVPYTETETVENTGYNLEAWGYSEEELQEHERERINMLALTAADVERAIYKAKGVDFEDIITLVSANPPEELDIKALKIELKANYFYRGNPYINAVGSILGFSNEQIDLFFQDGNYEHLVSSETGESEEE